MDLSSEPPPDAPEAEQGPKRPHPAVTVLVSTVALFLMWPIASLAPVNSLDASWQAGLHMAAKRGIPFGTEIAFTYGPLGFLNVPQAYFTSTGTAAVLYTLAVNAMLIGAIFHVVARRFGYLLGTFFALAIGALAFIEPAEMLVLISFAFLIASLAPAASERSKTIAVAATTVIGAVQVLVKFNTGIVILGMSVLFVFALPKRRGKILAGQLIAVPTIVVLLWVAAGEAISALPAWLRSSAELAAGYADAMGLELPSRWIGYPVAFAALAWLVILVWREMRGRPVGNGLALAGIVAALLFAEWKHGFVRHDGHEISFFLGAAVLALVLGCIARARRTLVVTSLALLIAVPFAMPTDLRKHVLRPGDAVQTIQQAAAGGIAPMSREQARRTFRLDGETLALLRGQSVHVDPYATFIAWTYDLDWQPVPVFQTYAAYTPYLDQLNADALTSSRGPTRVLKTHLTFANDRRNPVFETPRFVLALLCNFSELRATRRHEVLARSLNRCGAPRRLTGAMDATREVAVPRARPGELIYMRVEIVRSAAERLRALLHKPSSHPTVTFTETGGVRSFNLVEATSSGPLVLCVPRSAGFDRDFFPDRCPSTVLVSRRSSVMVTFYAITIRPA